MIDAEDRLPRQTVRLLGSRMSLVDAGIGPVLLFLHGNPTHSYAWRNIIPYLAQGHRCLAPDLMGMGRSDLILPSGPNSYQFHDHIEYLELLLEVLGLDRPVVLVGHEMGGALAIQLARRHPSLVSGLILIEAVFRVTNDDTLYPKAKDLLHRLRGEDGERLVLNENALVEQYMPTVTARHLTPDEMAAYRMPCEKPGESRRAMLSMIRQLPLKSSRGPIADLVEESRLWCAQTPMPKLVIGGNPGFLVTPSVLGTSARWASTKVTAVPGRHLLMEDSPARIASAIIDWLSTVETPV